ncbi:MerR family transcriptional regulator [Streptomyces sp. NPDC013187]|uniref:MerR family transcriptional regulator n=1 Tax=Streptomyces sp. NPDC013187 TaxID=3364865 RepID=UPI0036CCD9DC
MCGPEAGQPSRSRVPYGRNQAAYDDRHERRLRLIRTLLDVGGMKVAAIADVLTAVDDLARVLAALTRSGHGAFADLLDTYADAAERIAHADLACVDRRVAVEGVVIGTVLGESVLSALRRMAHVDASAGRYGTEAAEGPA